MNVTGHIESKGKFSATALQESDLNSKVIH